MELMALIHSVINHFTIYTYCTNGLIPYMVRLHVIGWLVMCKECVKLSCACMCVVRE